MLSESMVDAKINTLQPQVYCINKTNFSILMHSRKKWNSKNNSNGHVNSKFIGNANSISLADGIFEALQVTNPMGKPMEMSPMV